MVREPAAMPLEVLLPRVGAAVDRYRRRSAARYGLTPTAIDVLAALGHDEAPSHRELAGQLGLSPATLTPVLDALEMSGHVRRDRDYTDRRVVRLRRTAAGAQRLAAAQEPAQTLPQPAPEHEPAVRAYLLAVLAAADPDG
jgi:MarR family transcriptional regulator, organic hydroperoxide resistance regulator